MLEHGLNKFGIVTGTADDLAATGHKTCDGQRGEKEGGAGQINPHACVPSGCPKPEMQSDTGMKPDHHHGDRVHQCISRARSTHCRVKTDR